LLFIPPSLVFAAQPGGKPSLPVLVTDISRSNVEFTKETVSGPPFSISKNQCTGILSPLRTCVVTIQFSPSQAGQFNGKLTFADTAEGSPQTVWLYGTSKKSNK